LTEHGVLGEEFGFRLGEVNDESGNYAPWTAQFPKRGLHASDRRRCLVPDSSEQGANHVAIWPDRLAVLQAFSSVKICGIMRWTRMVATSGNRIGSFTELTKEDACQWFIRLSDQDSAYLPEGSVYSDDQVKALPGRRNTRA
jgi:hypothetical protein